VTGKGSGAYVTPQISALPGFSEAARLDRDASSLFDPVRDRWIMHNPIFKGHPISSESEGTERELMARAVLTT
jgi:hypothetical protein